MATDYDAPRRSEEDTASEPLEGLPTRAPRGSARALTWMKATRPKG